jgi:hypothetical protein
MSADDSARIAAAAAELVVEEGMEYGAAKRKAAQVLARREHIAVFHADTQPGELRALRRLALQWMHRLSAFRPHLSGAAWRGTATRRSALHIDLYCDDPKSAEIALLDLGLDFDVQTLDRPGQAPLDVLSIASQVPALADPVTVHLLVRDLDELRGALKADADGRSWRGDAAALERLLHAEDGLSSP